MNDLDVDMEELETRLYGQVYHTSTANTDFTSTCQITNNIPIKSFPRYFEGRRQNNAHHINMPPPFNQRTRLNSYLMLNPPVNSIVMLPPQQTQTFTPQPDSDKWFEKFFQSFEEARIRKRQKRIRRKLKRRGLQEEKQKLKKIKKTTINNKEAIDVVNEVVHKEEQSILVVDDDSDASTATSDVILIETPNEVISIDCEDVESIKSDMQKVVAEEAESTDFFIQKDGLSPTKNKDKCSVASSNSSTIDYTENFRGKQLINDLGARSSNDFSELNLDSFTNYIECNGKTSDDIPALSTSLLAKNARGKQFESHRLENSSESSSESEYEEDEFESISISSFSIGKSTPRNHETADDIERVKTNENKDNVITIDCEQSEEEVEIEEDSPEVKKFKLDVIDAKKENDESVVAFDTSESDHQASDNEFICVDEDNSNSSIELCLNESDKNNINSEKILNVEGGDIDCSSKNQNKRVKKFMNYWTEDMDQFYKESWGHEDFNVVEQQRQMSDNPNMWKILPRDRININCLGKQPRCRRCREFGHIAVKCTKRLDPPKCILCGVSGHFESRCPDKMCTSCGRKSNYFTTYCSYCASRRYVSCSICTMKGHLFYNCPDLWRRYLFTTTNGGIVTQPIGANLKQLEDQWCAGCGGNGHFEQNCCNYNRSHLPASVFIHDYSDVYSEQRTTAVFPQCSHTDVQNVSNRNAGDLRRNDTNRLSWQLTPKEQKRLALEGSTFLKAVENTLKVNVSINDMNCCIAGSKNNRVKAKIAVNTFCTNADLLKHIRIENFSFKSKPCNRANLEENFNYLENLTVNWRNVGESIYNEILLNEADVATEELYKKLNTIINAKLQLGDAKNHMKILKRCLEDNGDVMHQSFRYIFNSSNELTGDYRNLISQLPCEESNGDSTGYLEIERLRKTMENHPKFGLIDDFYHHVIINEYSDSSVSNFKTAVWRALSQTSKNAKRKGKAFRRKFLNKAQNNSFSC